MRGHAPQVWSLQRALEIGSYQTAWAMLHRLRSVLIRPERERLSGTVEVDETYVGGAETGLRGGRSKGKKVLVGVAVERRDHGFGRIRMAILPTASILTLQGVSAASPAGRLRPRGREEPPGDPAHRCRPG
jgi:hypothetical protein